jgi:hypothetical protein
MTARRVVKKSLTPQKRGVFETAILFLRNMADGVDATDTNEGMDENTVYSAELRAAIVVLRAAEKAKINEAVIGGSEMLAYTSNGKLTRAILNARRVHEKGAKCAK